MSILKKIRLAALLCFFSTLVFSQNENQQRYMVHMDPVKPGKVAAYEKTAADLVKMCKENSYEQGWSTFVTEDNEYMYLSPIKNFAELDENPMATLEEKVGEEKFSKIFQDFNKAYDSHSDFILVLDNELSYMPDGMSITQEGKNYRENTRYYYAPQDYEKALNVAKAFKKLYSDKNSKAHYRIYRSGLGTDGNYFLVASSAKSPLDMEQNRLENQKLMGEDARKLFNDLQGVILKAETVRGYMRPDLSYSPSK